MTPMTRFLQITGADRNDSNVSSGRSLKYLNRRIVVSLARDCEEPAFSSNPTREALVEFQTDFPDAVRVGVVRRAQHQSVPVEQIQQARVRLHELDHQADNAAQCRMEIRIANHKPADTLKETNCFSTLSS